MEVFIQQPCGTTQTDSPYQTFWHSSPIARLLGHCMSSVTPVGWGAHFELYLKSALPIEACVCKIIACLLNDIATWVRLK